MLVSEADEFGNPIAASTARYQWLGAKLRATAVPTGIMLMGARLYNPALGRFLQTDPIDGGSANHYDYANQDPVNELDLSGECGPCVAWGAGIVLKVGIKVYSAKKKAQAAKAAAKALRNNGQHARVKAMQRSAELAKSHPALSPMFRALPMALKAILKSKYGIG